MDGGTDDGTGGFMGGFISHPDVLSWWQIQAGIVWRGRQVTPLLYLATVCSHCPSVVRGRNFLPLQYIILVNCEVTNTWTRRDPKEKETCLSCNQQQIHGRSCVLYPETTTPWRRRRRDLFFGFKESKFPRSLKGMTTTMTHEEPVSLHMLKCNSHEYCHWKIIIQNTQRAKMLWAKVFCFTILWCCHVGNHPQEELAKLARKVEKFKESYYILATCWNLLSKKHADFRTFLQWWHWQYFSHKNPLYEFALNFFCHQMTKILPKNKIAGCKYFQNKFINCGGTSNSSRPSMIDGRSRFRAKGRRSFDCVFSLGRFCT
jgi:hypothetical protein